MPAILSKNCIVGGELDWYCLACCALLPAAEDAVAHIQAAAHKHNLTELPYADKYKDDFIRKARDVYFCEVCNVTFPTAAKIGMHVTETPHVAGKTGRQLKRAGTAVVFQENTLITERAWNGLVDDTCVLCNVEFDNESTHKSQQNHILNLINSSVTAHAANDIYRKIDGGYQCLTCNEVVGGMKTKRPEDRIMEHMNSEQHKSAFISYDQSQNEVNGVKNDIVTDEKSNDGDTKANIEPRKVDGKTLFTRPVLMKDKNKAACSSDVTEVETLAKQHGLSVNKGSSIAYCSVCSVQVTSTLDRINEHIDGKKHKDNLGKQSQANIQPTKNIKKIPTKDFIINIIEIRDTFTQQVFVVLNETIFLYRNIFLGLKIINHRYICLLCEIDLTENNVSEHMSSLSHVKVLDNCFVISSLEDEFIREIRRDLYHCGFCAIVENDLDDMMDHLDTAEHKKCKADLFTKMQVFKIQREADARIARANMFLNLLNLRSDQTD